MSNQKRIYTEEEKIRRRANQKNWLAKKRLDPNYVLKVRKQQVKSRAKNRKKKLLKENIDDIIIEIPFNLTFKIRFIKSQIIFKNTHDLLKKQNIINYLLSYQFYKATYLSNPSIQDWIQYKHNMIGLIHHWCIKQNPKIQKHSMVYRQPINIITNKRTRKVVPPNFPIEKLVNINYQFKT